MCHQFSEVLGRNKDAYFEKMRAGEGETSSKIHIVSPQVLFTYIFIYEI
jgi:hypothetical protein